MLSQNINFFCVQSIQVTPCHVKLKLLLEDRKWKTEDRIFPGSGPSPVSYNNGKCWSRVRNRSKSIDWEMALQEKTKIFDETSYHFPDNCFCLDIFADEVFVNVNKRLSNLLCFTCGIPSEGCVKCLYRETERVPAVWTVSMIFLSFIMTAVSADLILWHTHWPLCFLPLDSSSQLKTQSVATANIRHYLTMHTLTAKAVIFSNSSSGPGSWQQCSADLILWHTHWPLCFLPLDSSSQLKT